MKGNITPCARGERGKVGTQRAMTDPVLTLVLKIPHQEVLLKKFYTPSRTKVAMHVSLYRAPHDPTFVVFIPDYPSFVLGGFNSRPSLFRADESA